MISAFKPYLKRWRPSAAFWVFVNNSPAVWYMYVFFIYRAVTIQRPKATFAAKSELPPSKIKKPRSSLFCFSNIFEPMVASKKEFRIHCPSNAKQGTALMTANAPDSEMRYLQNVSIITGMSMLRKLYRGIKLLRPTAYWRCSGYPMKSISICGGCFTLISRVWFSMEGVMQRLGTMSFWQSAFVRQTWLPWMAFLAGRHAYMGLFKLFLYAKQTSVRLLLLQHSIEPSSLLYTLLGKLSCWSVAAFTQ